MVGRSGNLPLELVGEVEVVKADQADLGALQAALGGAKVIVHAAGPYQGLEPVVARAAIDLGVPYVDLADDQGYVDRLRVLAEEVPGASVPLVFGASAVPGLSSIFTIFALEELDTVDVIRSVAAPGTYGSRGGATFRSLLSCAGRSLTVPDLAGPRQTTGWSEPEWFDLPAPVGRRLTYLGVDAPDLHLFPDQFGARRVEFRAGSERPLLNRALAGLARIRHRLGHPRLEQWPRLAKALVGLIGLFGTAAGGFLVEITGRRDGQPKRLRYAVVSAERGAWIPALPAAVMATQLLRGEPVPPGLAPPWTWLTPARWREELSARGMELFRAQDDGPVGARLSKRVGYPSARHGDDGGRTRAHPDRDRTPDPRRWRRLDRPVRTVGLQHHLRGGLP